MVDAGTRLLALAETERKALLAGDFDRIRAVFDEKQALAHVLSEDPDAALTLAPLKAALERNHHLLDRALEGLRAVANRIGALDSAQCSIKTYDRQGQEKTIAARRTSTLEKRA